MPSIWPQSLNLVGVVFCLWIAGIEYAKGMYAFMWMQIAFALLNLGLFLRMRWHRQQMRKLMRGH